MLTANDFIAEFSKRIADFPEISARFYGGDPVILEQLNAMAVMLSMLSEQLEVAMAEPFDKVRDATVMADAALKGILLTATPVTASVAAFNRGRDAASIAFGTWLLDTDGRTYRVDASTIIQPGETQCITAVQISKPRVITHTVKQSSPFYRVLVPPSENGGFLNAIAVKDKNGEFIYSDKFTNVQPDERVFHVETDELQQMFVVFGYKGKSGPVVGHQPDSGDVLTITVTETAGDVAPPENSPFSFQYTSSPQQQVIDLTLKAIINPGSPPIDMASVRNLCRYPAVYDDNAVYLNEFDFMVRRKIQPLRFLAIWNESIEEYVRGPDVKNINTLFVASVHADDGFDCEKFSTDNSTESLLFLREEDLTDTQKNIRRLISQADESYRVRFVIPKRIAFGININATVPAVYDASAVIRKIKETLLAEYGLDTIFTKFGANIPAAQRISELLKSSVTALQSAESDFGVHLSVPDFVVPEHWLYLDKESVSAIVQKTNQTLPEWRNYSL